MGSQVEHSFQKQCLKLGLQFRGQVWKWHGKLTSFSLNKGQDLENWAVHSTKKHEQYSREMYRKTSGSSIPSNFFLMLTLQNLKSSHTQVMRHHCAFDVLRDTPSKCNIFPCQVHYKVCMHWGITSKQALAIDISSTLFMVKTKCKCAKERWCAIGVVKKNTIIIHVTWKNVKNLLLCNIVFHKQVINSILWRATIILQLHVYNSFTPS